MTCGEVLADGQTPGGVSPSEDDEEIGEWMA